MGLLQGWREYSFLYITPILDLFFYRFIYMRIFVALLIRTLILITTEFLLKNQFMKKITKENLPKMV